MGKLGVLLVLFGSALLSVDAAQAQSLTWMGVTPQGTVLSPAADLDGARPVSFDRRFYAFSTFQPLVAADTADSSSAVYLADRTTGAVRLVSVGAGGHAVLGPDASVSDDGRFVAYWSSGEDYVRDMESGTTMLVSHTDDWHAGGGDIGGLTVSPDGRFVALNSDSDLTGSGSVHGGTYVMDTSTGALRQVRFPDGSAAPKGLASFTANGNRLVLGSDQGVIVEHTTTWRSKLVPGGRGAVISRDGALIASGSSCNTASIYDTAAQTSTTFSDGLSASTCIDRFWGFSHDDTHLGYLVEDDTQSDAVYSRIRQLDSGATTTVSSTNNGMVWFVRGGEVISHSDAQLPCIGRDTYLVRPDATQPTTVPPTVSPPQARLRSGSNLSVDGVADMRVTWSVGDDALVVQQLFSAASHVVSQVPQTGHAGAGDALTPATPSGTAFQYTVQACNGLSQTSVNSARYTLSLQHASGHAFRYHGSWHPRKGAPMARVGSRGATVTVTLSRGTFAIVTNRGPGLGAFNLSVDGKKIRHVDLSNGGRHIRALVALTQLNGSAHHTIQITVTHGPVPLDAIVHLTSG